MFLEKVYGKAVEKVEKCLVKSGKDTIAAPM